MGTAFGQSAGSLALDFVNTVDWRDDPARRIDLIPTAATLAAWARHAGFPAAARACRLPGRHRRAVAFARNAGGTLRRRDEGAAAAGSGVGEADAMEPGRVAPSCAHQPTEDRGMALARAHQRRRSAALHDRARRRGSVAVSRTEPVAGLRRGGMRLVLLRSQQGRPAALVQHGGVRQPRQGAVVSRARVA